MSVITDSIWILESPQPERRTKSSLDGYLTVDGYLTGISTARETNKELIGRVSNYYVIVKYTTPLD